ncbi:class I SAM-dependent methyltransferase [Nitrospiraceae bacterium AH_259_D15_M11_P09]|nr:class I SAM-dependent methyltransferase [Nitrospiraceae bacterium AH_259_D15_M11_P09]
MLREKSRRVFWRYWYPYLTGLIKDSPLTFLNYGYIDLRPKAQPILLQPGDEPNRLCIQLYHHVAGALDLTGLTVMELSCGHGGGASYIKRYLNPKSYLAVDRNPKAIEFCRQHYSIEDLSFTQGDAEALQFDDQTFDVIINVEASHCYGNMAHFLEEVARILRPGGYFLFADFRSALEQEALDREVAQSGLEVGKKENITPNVSKAMEANNEQKLDLIEQLVPRILHKFVRIFAAVKGTYIFEGFKSGDMFYLSYVLRKPLA